MLPLPLGKAPEMALGPFPGFLPNMDCLLCLTHKAHSLRAARKEPEASSSHHDTLETLEGFR